MVMISFYLESFGHVLMVMNCYLKENDDDEFLVLVSKDKISIALNGENLLLVLSVPPLELDDRLDVDPPLELDDRLESDDRLELDDCLDMDLPLELDDCLDVDPFQQGLHFCSLSCDYLDRN